jgi:flagellar basal body-associated protein FliL/predicted RNA-binding Zn-ribbon protein involved in translation (DUF1610 family)
MDTALIPAVCPNCGGKLQVDTSADTVICQYCGTEHLIRRDMTGSVTLEAFARCPLCKRNDRSEKVSAILKNQTGQSESVVSQQRVYTDSKGHTKTQTVNVPVKTVQTSDIARRLAPPPPPPTVQSKSGKKNSLLVLSIIVMFIGIVLLFKSNFVWGIIFALIAVGGFFLWHSSRRKAQEKARQQQSSTNNAYQQWQQAISRWEKLYYCGRDDIIFIPGEITSAAVSDMLTYIHTNPAGKVQIPSVNSSENVQIPLVNSSGKNTFIYNLGQKIVSFWKDGKKGKLIIIVIAIVVLVGLCCVISIAISGAHPTSTATLTPSTITTSLPTEKPLPINIATLTNTAAPSPSTNTAAPSPTFTQEVQYQFVAHKGVIYYIITDKQYNSDRTTLEGIGKSICNSETVCQVWFFNDLVTATTSSKIVDATMAIATYAINRNTGFEQMLVCSLGNCK